MLHHTRYGIAGGKPVLFLHPGNATGDMWRDTVEALPHVDAFCPDLPGFGRSRNVPLDDFDDAADRLASYVRKRDIPTPLHVVGYSYGAYLGYGLCVRHRSLVASALLISFQIMPLAGAWWKLPLSDAVSPLMRFQWMRAAGFKAIGISRDSSWWPRREPPASARTWRQLSRCAVTYDKRTTLSDVDVPLLVIAGEDELDEIVLTVHLFERDAPQARGALAPGGHGWPIVHGRLFHETLISWLGAGVRGGPLPPGLKRSV